MPEHKPDAIGKRIKRWAGWGSAVSTGIVAVVAPIWVLVLEMRADIRDTKTGTEAGYETLAPIVAESQKLLYEKIPSLGSKVQDVAQASMQLKDRLGALEQRLTRCETYIEVMSRGRYKPAQEPLEPAEAESSVSTALDTPEVVQQAVQKPQRPVPESLRKAKAYQKKREKLECSNDDPLCGL